MEKSAWVWGRKCKRSPKEEVAIVSPKTGSSAVHPIQVPAGKAESNDVDRRVGNGGGEWAANLNSAASWEVPGELDYPPRIFNKYESIAKVHMTAPPPMIIITNNKRRMKSEPSDNVVVSEGKNIKKAKRMKKMERDEEEEEIEVKNMEEEEEGEMEEAWATRKPKFRSIAELYEVTLELQLNCFSS